MRDRYFKLLIWWPIVFISVILYLYAWYIRFSDPSLTETQIFFKMLGID